MSDSKSIVNVGELSRPATVLVEKIAEAIGGLARPWQIKRVAQAEAEADKIHAVAQIEITSLQKRAMTRLIAEEARKQNNIEAITATALPQLDSGAKPEIVEDDWIANFFDKCRLISDEQMQSLWAKILAGEANAPGKFSKRTIGVLASLDKSDATMFATLCSFACFVDNQFVPVIFNRNHHLYSESGIVVFHVLAHLENIGLIRVATGKGEFYSVNGLEQNTTVEYFGQKIPIRFPAPGSNNELQVGQVLFTQAGEQLAPICGAKPRDGFFEYLKLVWHGQLKLGGRKRLIG